MIIDDDEVNNFLFPRQIKEAGIQVRCVTCTNGKRALTKLYKWDREGGKQYPNIILLDLAMPVMDGFRFLDKYEEELAGRHPDTEIYMLSNSIDVDDRNRSKSYSSVSNFISKPLPIPALQEIIMQHQLGQGSA